MGLNRWLQLFLTIIAGAVVAVIAWSIITRFLHILILLVASFIVAYLLAPLVERLQRGGVPRPLGILLVYLVIFGTLTVGIFLLVTPLTNQVNALQPELLKLGNPKEIGKLGIVRFLQGHGIKLDVRDLSNQIGRFVSQAGTTLLGSTLTIIAGTVSVITDVLLTLAITFYLLLDGKAMHNRAVRLLPTTYRDRWFFFEAALNKVLGGYVRGQLIVAATVGFAAGLGCWLLHVNYPLVIGLLAFLFEFIPMLGPVLGMIPAVLIALFQDPHLAIWVTIYFIVLQQIESNVIVPRVSGHAVGLHPLAALLALLIGVELGGIGVALLSVPLAGIIWVMVMALYADATGQTNLLVRRPRPRYVPYSFFARHVIDFRRGRAAPPVMAATPIHTATDAAAATSLPVTNERLASIKQEQEHLIEQFEADQAEQTATEETAVPGPGPDQETRPRGPNDIHAPNAI